MKKKTPLNRQEWQSFAERRLRKVLPIAKSFPHLTKMGPKAPWAVEVNLVGRTKMIQLNGNFRGKHYATDVLSFPTLAPFRSEGLLGDLVICLPTLKAQARALGHSPQMELEVLLIHGVLHLLGLDHERSRSEAVRMAKWEAKILAETLPGQAGFGLIDRSKSGI